MTGTPEREASRGRDQQYLAYAEAYTEAARQLVRRADNIDAVRIPFFHLVGHALELILKVAISRQGYDEDWLMRMGHDLEGCYFQATTGVACGLEDEDLAGLVEALDRPHAMQAFRYPQWFHWPMPEPAQAVRLLSRQLDIIRAYVAADR